MKHKCEKCGQEIKQLETIKIGNVEYETTTHDFNKKLKEIKIPKGWRLWTAEECIKLHNNLEYRKKLNLEKCWFFIKQPFDLNNKDKSVARFGAYSGGADLNCDGDPSDSNWVLGVRFCRDLK